MKPKLFLHIGSHKTGSTAIQQAFKEGAQGPLGEGLVRLTECELVARATWDPTEGDKIIAALRAKISKYPGKRFVMSSEEFSGNPLTGYADASVMASRLRGVTRDFDVTVIVFVRRQDDFIESLYTQMIHQGSFESFDEFMQKMRPGCMDWQALLESYAQVFGRENMVVRRYHPDFYPGPDCLLKDFCDIVGVNPEVLKQKLNAVRNQGYSTEAVELARICNPHLDKDHRKMLRKTLQKASPKPVFQSYSYLNPEARQQFMTGYVESNEKVRREYFPEVSDTSLFPALKQPSGPQEPPQTAALIAQMMKTLLDMKAVEKRSGMLRFMMRMENAIHSFFHRRAS